MAKSSPIYLDYAAATPLDNQVLAAMQPYFNQQFYNPSASYLAAQKVHKELEAARALVANWLGSRPSEVIFTAGGTEANNLAIHGLMRQYPEAEMLVSAVEHESVLEPAKQHNHQLINVQADGSLDLDDLSRKITENTLLISVMYANNEVGTIQPIRVVAKLVAEERRQRRQQGNDLPIYLHTDACQAGNYLDLHVSRLGVDLMTLNGGKLYGPKQSGTLFIKAGLQLKPLVSGGGQEQGLRSGTENVAAAIGFAAALDLAQKQRHPEVERMQNLQKRFTELLEAQIPSLVLNGSHKNRLPNNLHVTIPGHDNERLLIQLDEAGILAAAGSACSASDEEPSHVLKAMGLSDTEAQASLRFTMGRDTTEDMVKQAVDSLASIVAQN